VIGSTHGCSDEQPVEDFCGFMANTGNCYSEFHEDLGAACGSKLATDVQGTFGSRAMLDVCVLSRGGQAVFDPPIDPTKPFPTGKLVTVKIVTPTGLECGSIGYTSQYSFEFTVNAPPGSDAGAEAGTGTPDQASAAEAAEPHWTYGTVASSSLPGRDTVDVSCSAPNVASSTQVVGAETHHFNLNQVIQGDKNCGCSQYSQIIPQAILEFNAGGVNTPGSVRLRIQYPPPDTADDDKGVTHPAGQASSSKDCSTQVAAVPADVVYYFDCGFPGALPICGNGAKDSTETDTDCGGPETAPNCPIRCGEGQACLTDCDCDASSLCKNQKGALLCTASTAADGGPLPVRNCVGIICSNQLKDASESDVDCGGVCPKCDVGRTCNGNTDCISGNCVGGVCTIPNCNNTLKDGTETDVDCGGGGCPPCALDMGCVADTDCLSGGCTNGKCSTCGNKKQDPPETDVDCGGNTCGKCGDGLVCKLPEDCLSGNCFMNICISCTNGKQDGTETDVDCGGACSGKCTDGQKCLVAGDCDANVCFTDPGNVKSCNTCHDGIKDGKETAADCGGGFCPKCADTLACVVNIDCLSGICIDNVCKPSCGDGVKNGTETDIDCGGTCPKCVISKTCAVNGDCLNDTCLGGACFQASCADGMKNNDETDTDCGGTCPKCDNGKTCKAATDCKINGCDDATKTCSACANMVKDGAETDTDCGGGTCAPCASGKSCNVGTDCASTMCSDPMKVCQ
jgi:hypothetical protein